MAYDNYRSPPMSTDHQPYPHSYDYTQIPDPRQYQPFSPPLQEYDTQPRTEHVAYDAVNNAFDKSSAASQVSPEIIAQITEQVRSQVIDSLKAERLAATNNSAPSPIQQQENGGNTQRSSPPPSQYQSQSYSNHSQSSPNNSTFSGSIPSRKVYTPPSPERPGYFSEESDHDRKRDSKTSRSKADTRERESKEDMRQKDIKEDLASRHGERLSSPEKTSSSRTRPAAPRSLTNDEETILEKIWQPLFDANGQPTPRLGQILRGLALHLVEDYEPKLSLVISPAKMQQFYREVKISEETYPWDTIFGKLAHSTISRMYRALRCEHHLIQDEPTQEPYIPALTPRGFETWMTAMIQGHPNEEFERLAKAVLDMPISNSDDRKERFPKELSRRLFPKTPNLHARQRCAAAVCSDPNIAPPSHTSFPPPPPMQQPPMGGFERERKPYASQPDISNSSAIHDDDSDEYTDGSNLHRTTSIPIERERKPYTARAGGGRVYSDLDSNMSSSVHSTTQSQSTSQTLKADIDRETRARKTRSSSTVSQGAFSAAPVRSETSPPRRHPSRRDSKTYAARRAHSPSFSNAYTRSDGNVGDINSSYYTASNMYAEPEEDRRYRDPDWARRAAEAESERYYDDWRRRGGSSAGMGPTGGSGSDGYGSFGGGGGGYGAGTGRY